MIACIEVAVEVYRVNIVVDMGEREYGLKRDQVKLPGHSDLLHM